MEAIEKTLNINQEKKQKVEEKVNVYKKVNIVEKVKSQMKPCQVVRENPKIDVKRQFTNTQRNMNPSNLGVKSPNNFEVRSPAIMDVKRSTNLVSSTNFDVKIPNELGINSSTN